MTNEERIDDLLRIVVLAVDMRAHQAAYFRSRDVADLIASKNAEKVFDTNASRALLRHGLDRETNSTRYP